MRRFIVVMSVAALLATMALPSGAQADPDRAERSVPESIEELRLDRPLSIDESIRLGTLDPALADASGEQRVIVRLRGDSLAASGITNENEAARHVNSLKNTQNQLLSRVLDMDSGAREIASVQRVLNAVFVEVDASALDAIAADPDVARIAPVGDYELDLSETVPYIGASAVQADGVDGSGIKVAVLDSGIDYTHANLGGEGTLEAYEAAWGTSPDDSRNTTRDGLFPTAKVVDGYDFVGEFWVGGADTPPEVPDPDPIDFEGHGTHVADIIGGVNGVAPGVELYAVKTCAALSSACSGIALIQGMEFAVDPNGDGKVKDRVDVINMSLGLLYGQPFDDDLSAAVDGATALGVLTVASAGNSGDNPFVTGAPSAAATALSVAQTQVPSATKVDMEVIEPTADAGFYEAVFQPWSKPLAQEISGPVTYGDGSGGNLNGCAEFAPGSLNGIVAVDRGACDFSLKIQNIEAAGGSLGIIMTVDDTVPFPGGFGGGPLPQITGYMIGNADGDILRAGAAVVSFDPAIGTPLIGTMVGSSSRGPQFQDLRIKPEIGAPGASISAEATTGTGETPFGGTSGAAPMVAGSAALLLDGLSSSNATPARGRANGNAVGQGPTPLETKALLMNTGEIDIDIAPGEGAAEITRIGGGEVRVDRALSAPIVAYDEEGFSGGLSFGYVDVTDTVSLTKTVTIKNLDNDRHTFAVTPTFRFAEDAASGAITVDAPSTVTVQPGKGKTTSFDVTITIDGSKLSGNPMNSGSNGADPKALTAAEFDGYLLLEDGFERVHMPWHVLPRKAAQVEVDRDTFVAGLDVIGTVNTGVGTAQMDAYSLVVTDEELPEGARGQQSPTPDIRGVGVNTFPVDFCDAGFIWAFAFDNWERQTHAISPGISWIDLDTDQDGTPDYAVYSYSLAGLGDISDGRVVTWSAPYVDFDSGEIGPQSAFFFTEHSTFTGNTVLLICGEQIGLTQADLLTTNVTAKAYAFDIYFGGPDDETDEFTITPLGERFVGFDPATFSLGLADIPGGEAGQVGIVDFGPFPGNTDELGLLVFTNGDRGAGNRGGATEDTEALYFLTE